MMRWIKMSPLRKRLVNDVIDFDRMDDQLGTVDGDVLGSWDDLINRVAHLRKGGQIPRFQHGGIVRPRYASQGMMLDNLIALDERVQPIINNDKSTIRKAYKQAKESGENVIYIKRKDCRDKVTFDFVNKTGTYASGWTGHPTDDRNAIAFNFDEIERYQSGGKIPGFGGGDRVPILAEQGEYVVRKEATKNNLQLLEGINAGRVQRLQYGGMAGVSYAARGGSQFDTVAEILASPRFAPLAAGASAAAVDARNTRLMTEFQRLAQTFTDNIREMAKATGVTSDSIRLAEHHVKPSDENHHKDIEEKWTFRHIVPFKLVPCCCYFHSCYLPSPGDIFSNVEVIIRNVNVAITPMFAKHSITDPAKPPMNRHY